VNGVRVLPVRAGENQRVRLGQRTRQLAVRLYQAHVVLPRMLDA
jgi:hypothetical protein